jgi:phage-related protein
MGELQEEIGAKLLPVMLKLSEAGLKVVDWITQNQAAAAAIIGTFGGLLAVVKLVSVATTIWSTVTKVAAAAQVLLNIALAANPVVLIVLAVVALAAALVLAYKKSETFRNIVNGVFGAIADTVGRVVEFIKGNWQKMLVILTGPIGLAVALIVKHWDTIQAGAAGVINWVNNTWSNLKEKLAGPIDAAKGLITGYLGGIESAFSAIVSVIQSIIDKVQALIDKIKSIPHPDIPFVGRVGAGGGGTTTGAGGLVRTPQGTLVVNVSVPGGFIGDDVALARKLKSILGSDLRRVGAA